MCSRHEARHMPRLRLAPLRAHARSRVAVAELGVVRRFHLSSVNVNLSPIPLRELVVSLGGFGFGGSYSLSVSANAFCCRQRMVPSQVLSSRSEPRFFRFWTRSASLTTRAFGDAERALKFGSASCFGSVLLRTPTPNHALQRTRAAVTAPASGLRLSPPAQGPRQPRGSLSLGSLGVARVSRGLNLNAT